MARALMAMDDVGLRAAVAAGDFSSLDVDKLDDEERRMLRDAARGEADDIEAEGFGFGFGTYAPPYVPVGPNLPLMQAVRYTEDGLTASPVKDDFTAWTGKLGAQGTW
jgi:hypothetical protein